VTEDLAPAPTDQDNHAARLKAARRLLAAREARDDMHAFIRLMMPDELDPEDATLSEYKETAHGRLLRDIVQKVEARKLHRVAIALAPQMGKTIHLSTYGLAWMMGRNPRARIVLATYNEIRAGELGEDFRRVVNSPAYQQIFPETMLETGSQSKTSMSTTRGGKIFFVGIGGTITGRTAHYFFIDDPLKGDEDAQSDTLREKMWTWFFSVAYSRGGNKTPIVVIHTRWHQDDLIGRLCDDDHPERNKRYEGLKDGWKYLNIAGVITDPKLAVALGLELKVQTEPRIVRAFGVKPMAALWEAEKSLSHYVEWKMAEPRTFNALVMGNPSAEDGEYFKREWIVEYDREDLPALADMTVYGASDHGVSLKEGRDPSVLGCIGIDKNNDIWLLPDLVWDQMETPRTVEEILTLMRTNSPAYWWMESELISKSFGPFLMKRMEEENVYVPIDAVVPSKDKATRARAIQGRLAMRKVRFPRFAPWYTDAVAQLLKFPNGAHDDFVDWLAHVGAGLMKQYTPSTVKREPEKVIRTGSIAWMMAQTRATERRRLTTARKASGW
jgi:predicted phage terminase large subunit-like protein